MSDKKIVYVPMEVSKVSKVNGKCPNKKLIVVKHCGDPDNAAYQTAVSKSDCITQEEVEELRECRKFIDQLIKIISSYPTKKDDHGEWYNVDVNVEDINKLKSRLSEVAGRTKERK